MTDEQIKAIWETVEWQDLNPLYTDFNHVLRMRFARALIAKILKNETPHDSDCSTNNRGVPELLGPCD